MKTIFLSLLYAFSLLLLNNNIWAAEELYIITTRDGTSIVARDYRFTDEYIEFTTKNGLPGFIKRTEFVKIENMVGVPPEEPAGHWEVITKEIHEKKSWVLGGGLLVIVIAVMLVYLGGKRTKARRKEREPKTQGCLSFEYKGFLGRTSKGIIDVRMAYEEDGVLYVEGICTATDKRKKFRADRVVGPVTDLSSDHHAPMDHFFVHVEEG